MFIKVKPIHDVQAKQRKLKNKLNKRYSISEYIAVNGTKFICEKTFVVYFLKFIIKEEMIKLTFCSIMSIRLKRRKAKEIKSNSKHQAFDKFNIVARLCYVYIYGNDIRVSRVNNIYMEGNYVLGYGLVFSIQIESFHSRESVRAAYIVSSPISFFINFNIIKNRYNETKISLQLRFR